MLQCLRNCYERLALTVNEGKTAVGPVWGRKFLGHCLMASPQWDVKRAVARPVLDKLRDRIRRFTRRSRERSLEQMAVGGVRSTMIGLYSDVGAPAGGSTCCIIRA